MFSYYGQRENFAYPRNSVVLDAKIENVQISHVNLDLGITMRNKWWGKPGSNLHELKGSYYLQFGISFPVFPNVVYPVCFTHWPYLPGTCRYLSVTSGLQDKAQTLVWTTTKTETKENKKPSCFCPGFFQSHLNEMQHQILVDS